MVAPMEAWPEDLAREIEEAVQKAVLLSLFTMPDIPAIEEYVYCSYRAFLKHYTEAKLRYLQFERVVGKTSEWLGFQDTIWSKRQFLQSEYSRLEKLVYRNPCKICDVCQTRRKEWP